MRKKKDGTLDKRFRGPTNKPKSGRKSKAEEFALIERLDQVINPEDVMIKWQELIMAGNMKAIEMYNHYRFGKPVDKQIQITQEVPTIDMNEWK